MGKARMLFQPAFDLRMFVRCIVVYDQMEFSVCRSLFINECQKTDPFLMAMAFHLRRYHGAVQRIESGKQWVVPWRL